MFNKMRLYTELPRDYFESILRLPPFEEDGSISLRTENALENTLFLYSNLAKKHSKKTDNNPRNYKIKSVSIVGSGAKNRVDSDLDFLLIVPELDLASADNLKLIMSYVLYCDRKKQEAIDVYIRQKDKYPERKSRNITFQAKDLLKKYNSKLR